MASPVTISGEVLEFNTLPALKVKYYTGNPPSGKIYTFARFYFHKDALALSLSVFEQTPDPSSCVEFGFSGGGDSALRFRLWPGKQELVLQEGAKTSFLDTPPVEYFKGSDEQGWSWGAVLELNVGALEKAGFVVKEGEPFRAAVFKTQDEESALGASFDLKGISDPFAAANYTPFAAVAY